MVVHYHEIALKGKNRPMFVRRLAENLRAATQGLGVKEVRRLTGRLVLVLSPTAALEEVRRQVAQVPGIANFALAYRTPLQLKILKDAILQALAGRTFRTFRVQTRRGFKAFPLTSPDINRDVGHYLQQRLGAGVDLEAPELTVSIEILPHEAFFFFDREPGPGGLPVGVSGTVACLLSGGIDSPVAAYRLLKRGCTAVFMHFHSYPILSRVSQEKARDLVAVLTRYQFASKLVLIPFALIQQQIVADVAAPYRIVLYRRFMVRIAEELARVVDAKALVTGESVGQVASQTLENLAAINAVAGLPILRPLIGMDKQEIVTQAIALGTYDISIIPDQDCCTLFVPHHPIVRADSQVLAQIEARLDMQAFIQQGIATVQVLDFVQERGRVRVVPGTLLSTPQTTGARDHD
ncbi:MAG TPA: tRNA uracil 4-sulfurtransferase ThiI [Candidatus Tectomicrobia bacterium]|nr:tRNA uracil 4-sulfurtransferase ThiI [Candidatus Tectomicrobia bacterium]